jgi:hypothetical protein
MTKNKYGGHTLTVQQAYQWVAAKLKSTAAYLQNVIVVAVDGGEPPCEQEGVDLDSTTAEWALARDVRLKMPCGALLSGSNPHRTAKQHRDSCRLPACSVPGRLQGVPFSSSGGGRGGVGGSSSSAAGPKRQRPANEASAGSVLVDEDDEDEADPLEQPTLDQFMPSKGQVGKVSCMS